ncbi:ADP-ribose pyrophosphatase, partial [Pseudoalteromonas phenolica]
QWQWFSLDELPQPLFLPLVNFLEENNTLYQN